MRHSVFFFIFLWALTATTSLLAQETHVLRFATEAANPPFHYLDKQGRVQGLDIEIARHICQRLKTECVFRVVAWPRLVPTLKNRRVDAIISSYKAKANQRHLLFTQPYLHLRHVLLTDKQTVSPFLPKDGVRLGAEIGSLSYQSSRAAWPLVDTRPYGTALEALTDLSNGLLVGVVMDELPARQWLQGGKDAACCHILQAVPFHTSMDGQGLAIALRPDDKQLKARLDSVLQSMRDDGTLHRLTSQFLPLSASAR